MGTSLTISDINWWAVLVSVIACQVFLTLWFAVLFREPWAREYGAKDARQHTSEIPGYTYAIGLACSAALTLGVAMILGALGVAGAADALAVGVMIAVCFVTAALLPGYAFLRRWRGFWLVAGSQAGATLIVSMILGVWRPT